MKTAIVYATDENYVKLTAVSLYSLLKSTPSQSVVVLANGLSEADKHILMAVSDRFGGDMRIIDVNNTLAIVRDLGANGYVSFSAYSRLFIAKLLGDEFDRAVYLDGDTVVSRDISPLFDMPLGGKAFAIGYDCLCNRYKKLVGLPSDAPYFNSGVLLIDLATWRERHCTERIFDYMRKVRNDFMFGDQDYFSVVLANDAAVLPPEYNFLTHFQMFKRQKDVLRATGIPSCAWYGDAQYSTARRNPAIHHFLGNTLGRPWYRESLNPMRETYRRLAAGAGVPEVAEQSRPVELCYRVQNFCWRHLPQPAFAVAVNAMYRYFFRTRYGV